MTEPQTKGVLNLADVRREHLRQVGNKAALLGELHGAHLPTVPGVVLCADTCAGLRKTRSFPDKLLADLEAKLDSSWPECRSFAIRTSVVEGQRAAEQNLRDTRCEYFVPRDALVVAIIAAASAPPANHDYLNDSADTSGPSDDLRRAVIVQPMVSAQVSGAVFTGGVQSGGVDSYLIEACWGLGRALVEGQTDPDRYQLDNTNQVTECQRGRKQHQIKSDGSGLLVAVSEEERLAWTLNESQLKQITALAKRCASILGGIQDVEFAWTEDSGPVVLQSRPVTAAKLAPENVPAGKWLIHLPTFENFAEPFTPLSEDLLRGVLPGFARLIHGRVYLNFETLRTRLPVQGSQADLTDALLHHHELAKLPLSFAKLIKGLPRWLPRLPATTLFWWRSRSLDKERLAQFWDHANALASASGDDAKTLFEQFVHGPSTGLFSAPWRLPFKLNASSARYLLHMAVLHRLLKRWAQRELDNSTLQQLCTSNADTLSNDMVADIAAMGRQVAQTPELVAAFDAPLDGLALHQLLDAHANPSFVSQFSAFVQRFGHRGSRELELAGARWLEEPNALLAMIGIAAKQQREADGYGLQLLARDDLHQAIRHSWQRRIIDYLLRRIKYYVSLRENTRHYAARAVYLVRRCLLTLEDRLIREQKIDRPGDLFFLNWNDIRYLDNGQLSPDNARTLIAAAKDQHAERCANSVRWTIGYTPNAADAEQSFKAQRSDLGRGIAPQDAGLDVVWGRCAAPGTAEGAARVVTSERDLAEFRPGEVLVLAFADPTMAAAVRAAAAVVCERGSAMSHLSLLAREWGIPFVTSAPDCTRRIATGEQVSVNANSGEIVVHPDAKNQESHVQPSDG